MSTIPRVALVADGLHSLPGLAETITQLRRRGVAGYEVEVIGTDPGIVLREGSYDLVHVCGPGPSGVTEVARASASRLPVTGSIHTELPTGEPVAGFLRACDRVLSPSRFADQLLRRAGVPDSRLARWQAGVDLDHFGPGWYSPHAMPAGGVGGTARLNVLCAGPLTAAKGVGLLADAFELARERDPRLHLVLAGSGPEEDALRRRFGPAATFLGRLDPDQLARALASADLLVQPSARETFGRIVLQAQASGLPVLAVDAGGAAELIETGRSGFLVEPTPGALAEALRWLARRGTLRERLATGGLLAVRSWSWERSLAQLAGAWSDALAAGSTASPGGRGAELKEMARVA